MHTTPALLPAKASLRIAIDTGGTFTDLVVDAGDGPLRAFKSSTTPDDPTTGILAALMKAAQGYGVPLRELLQRTELLVHGTTRALNALVTQQVAKTALLVTAGHPDILLYGEGGRSDLFNFTRPARRPFIPRGLTFEVPERIGAGGTVVTPLDEDAVARIAGRLAAEGVEAVAVALLWSPLNDAHERQVAQILADQLPGVPVTLSSALNPTLREYRRTSSAAIDASLKPLMALYLQNLDGALREHGFAGRLLVITSAGGFLDAAEVARQPILSVKSGPVMAPVAGRAIVADLAQRSPGGNWRTVIVTDTGGTTYDVSVLTDGRIPTTRETWLGEPLHSDLTGFNSIDVRSVGAGGGSIAWVDDGGVLHVGPRSAGAVPGPAAYGTGGTEPTLTDACLVLGYLDAAAFLGGSMPLRADLAAEAVDKQVARPLGIGVVEAAEAIHRLASERMIAGIEAITLAQGVDPAGALLVAGGGAGGLNAAAVAARLGCARVLVPGPAAVLSAYGALSAELSRDFEVPCPASTSAFDAGAVGAAVRKLTGQCDAFLAGPGAHARSHRTEWSVEARYPNQVWDLTVSLPDLAGRDLADGLADQIARRFHELHEQAFAVADPRSPVELITWHATVFAAIGGERRPGAELAAYRAPSARRRAYFHGSGSVDAAVLGLAEVPAGAELAGPAIVETDMTTVVVPPGASCTRTGEGHLFLTIGAA